MDNLYFLIDTNIFIQLEDDKIISDSFNKFHRLCSNENPSVIRIHPLSITEIEKDTDTQRRKRMLSKIDKYNRIEDPPLANEQEIQ